MRPAWAVRRTLILNITHQWSYADGNNYSLRVVLVNVLDEVTIKLCVNCMHAVGMRSEAHTNLKRYLPREAQQTARVTSSKVTFMYLSN